MVDLLLKDTRTRRLLLPKVTVAIVDCVAYKPARRVLQHCINLCEFADAKIFTHEIPEAKDDPYAVFVDKIASKQAYSHFLVKKLADYVKTDFILIVQTDGFIVNVDKWTDRFLEYDYIGSPWHHSQLQKDMNPEHRVGNGGFSLRSRRLHEFLRDDPNIVQTHPEDVIICQTYRDYLEDKGFTFAPVELSHQFGCENYIWNNAFGQHQYFTLHPAR
jgi:hypothetical protein